MKIQAIETGRVRVHERQRTGAGRGLFRFAGTLLDRQWTDWLPIHAWVIEHDEGLFVVDTGETAKTAEPGYFPRWHPYYRLAVRMQVTPEEEIGPRLRQLGLPPQEVRAVVLTHLHTDHAGGLHHFPGSRILVSRPEHDAARGWPGRLRGYLPQRWPQWYSPVPIDFVPEPFGPFPESRPLTRGGDIRIVPTPGHTAGHVSVVVDEGDRVIFLAGDTSYTEHNLVAGRIDGVSSMGGGETAAAQTLARIRTLAGTRPTVYLPTHDPAAVARLASRQAVAMAPTRAVA